MLHNCSDVQPLAHLGKADDVESQVHMEPKKGIDSCERVLPVQCAQSPQGNMSLQLGIAEAASKILRAERWNHDKQQDRSICCVSCSQSVSCHGAVPGNKREAQPG